MTRYEANNLTPPVREDLSLLMDRLRTQGEPFALATVVRTLSVTAAKAGAKAVITADGAIAGGWIGGGCARGAVLKAARQTLEDGQPKLVSIQPEDLLKDLGVGAGDERDGVRFARNMCPSQGSMDIFVEPVLPRPVLTIFGGSPVAVALSDLAPRLGFEVTVCAQAEDLPQFHPALRLVEGFDHQVNDKAQRFCIVATQGKGDQLALKAALGLPSAHLAFVGSRRKAEVICEKLRDEGQDLAQLDRLKAPAGLDLGAITPEEIALSILAEILAVRRKSQRQELDIDAKKTDALGESD
ncbi:XdhC family protein [Roseibium sp.]|uniref:XdhC family protein n=1 Tax=Roseibium sp. TaxID=1936156 RepID=UPI003A968CF8